MEVVNTPLGDPMRARPVLAVLCTVLLAGTAGCIAPDTPTPVDLPPQLREAHPSGLVLVWLRSLGGGVFAALRGGLVAAITQDWLQVGVAV